MGSASQKSLQVLTIDRVEVSYIDCSGLATLVDALKVAHARQFKLLLKGVPGNSARSQAVETYFEKYVQSQEGAR